MDINPRTIVFGVGTSSHVEQQVNIGSEVLPPEIEADYNLWTLFTLTKEFPRYPLTELKRVLHENGNRFAPSYKAISADYAAALAAEQNGTPGFAES